AGNPPIQRYPVRHVQYRATRPTPPKGQGAPDQEEESELVWCESSGRGLPVQMSSSSSDRSSK
ncbi:hypothetical protein AVEN_170221-1, partial [Araneus ventricosus]